MTVDPVQLYGADLRLLGNLLEAEQRERGGDLHVAPRPQLTSSGGASPTDLQRVRGDENLQQALLLRFLTQVGELADLGHPAYGSRLHELVGELNTETTRNRAKLLALQALQAEPRVARVRRVVVETDRARPTWIEIKADLEKIGESTPLNFVFGMDLGGG